MLLCRKYGRMETYVTPFHSGGIKNLARCALNERQLHAEANYSIQRISKANPAGKRNAKLRRRISE